MSFSEFDVDRRTKKSSFLKNIDVLIDWNKIETIIIKYYRPKSDVTGRPAYAGLLLFKMLLCGIWYGGLSDESVEDMANANLHVMRFLKLSLEDDVPDHSVLSRFRSTLTAADAWDGLLTEITQQMTQKSIGVSKGYHVDASITLSQHKPKKRPTYEVVLDREERDDEAEAKTDMEVVIVTEPQVDAEARWTKKGGHYHFGYKQHTLVNDDGIVVSVMTTAANKHDSVPLEEVIEKAHLPEGSAINGDKAYASKKHTAFLKSKKLFNRIQTKATKTNPLTDAQKRRNSRIAKVRYVVERTFGSQARWFNSKIVRYKGLAKAHAWHSLLAMAYNIKRFPQLVVKYGLNPQPILLQDQSAF